ncbi:MAG: single-stranded DNA-binding protein [Gemmatimonadetes bacterium]|nr:single-stranded DNA-binding protein [Gemmatimonadota bacterium]
MARSLNKVMLIGNLGAAPEMKTTPSGTKVARFSIATNRQWKNQSGQEQEKTEWHRCTAWAKLADVVEQYVKKGDRLYIEGRIEYSETESDGQKKYWTDINVQEMVMLGGSGGAEGGGSGRGGWSGPSRPKSSGPSDAELAQPDDDLPF